jgi:hypothetical protein
MWYKIAQQKINLFGLPTSGGKKFKQYQLVEDVVEDDEAPTDLETKVDEDGIEIPTIEPKPEEVTVEIPTPEDGFTTEDLEQKVVELETDPTANIKLPPLHEDPDPQCYCRIESRPILSRPGINDARRVWIVNHRNQETGRPINNCPKCLASAAEFNEKEAERLRNKGIDVDPIT